MADAHFLRVDSRVVGEETVVIASGDLNRRTSDRLRAELRQHSGHVAVDLSEVDHLTGQGSVFC